MMWKPRKEEDLGSTTPTGYSVGQSMNSPRVTQPDQARIGKGVQVKGEISGAEDLYIDGEVQGSISLREQVLTIGPNGKVRAAINAGQAVVHGTVDGNITAKRVELKSSAKVIGDVSTERIIMEDGAYLKGSVDVHKQSEARQESVAAAAAPSSSTPMPEPVPAFAHAGMQEKKVQ
jgi:cytoskeletal protein CcmA (bactofilin family)